MKISKRIPKIIPKIISNVLKKRVSKITPKKKLPFKFNGFMGKVHQGLYKCADKLGTAVRIVGIKKRLIISFGIILTLSVVSMSLVSVNYSGGLIKGLVGQYSEQELKQISNSIQGELDSYKSELLSTAVNNKLQTGLLNYSRMKAEEKEQFKNLIKTSVLKNYLDNPDLYSFVLADIDGGVIIQKDYKGENFGSVVDSFEKNNMNVQIKGFKAEEQQGKEKHLKLFRVIRSTATLQNIAYLYMELKEEAFSKIYEGNLKGGDHVILIANNEGMILSTNSKDIIGKKLGDVSGSLTSTGTDKKASEAEVNGKKVIVESAEIKDTDWKIISLTPLGYINREGNAIKVTIILIGLATLVLAMLISLRVSQSISKPLKKLYDRIEAAKEGKLIVSTESKSGDEVSRVSNSFNGMIENLGEIINSVKKTTEKVAEGSNKIMYISEESYSISEEIAATMNTTAEGAQYQAEKMTNTTEILNELSVVVEKLQGNLRSTDSLINSSKTIGKEAEQSIEVLRTKSEDTKLASEKIYSDIAELHKLMLKILDTTNMIASLTEQTNMLSLNASIEAARAGDSGKGFTVVSEQVRKLADRTKSATDNIHDVVYKFTKKIEKISKEASVIDKTITEQDKAINETRESNEKILDAMERINEYILKVLYSVNRIYSQRDDTVKVIENVSAVSEETSAVTEEVTASSQEQINDMKNLSGAVQVLNDMVKQLNEAINIFQISKDDIA